MLTEKCKSYKLARPNNITLPKVCLRACFAATFNKKNEQSRRGIRTRTRSAATLGLWDAVDMRWSIALVRMRTGSPKNSATRWCRICYRMWKFVIQREVVGLRDHASDARLQSPVRVQAPWARSRRRESRQE